MSKVKVAIAIPTGGSTPSLSMQSLWLQAFHLGKYQAEHPGFEFFLILSERFHVAYNRERIASIALQNEATHLLFIDDDMIIPPDLFEKLYRHQVDVCSALAFTRNPPHVPVLYQIHEGYDGIERKYYCKADWIKNYPRNSLVEVDAVGFGAVLINTEIFKKMNYPYFMCSSSSTGEDVFFCIQAKKAGARIFCDTSTILGHLGNPVVIDQTTSEQFNDPKVLEQMYGPYVKYDIKKIGIEDDPKELVGK